MSRSALVISSLVLFVSACASAPPPQPSSAYVPGEMLGLDEEPPPWQAWTPSTSSAHAEALKSWVAFDGLRPDVTQTEHLWSVLFAILSVARSVAPDARADATAHTLMAFLEPGPGARGEVFFVARRRGQGAPSEGVVVTVTGEESGARPIAHLRMHREVSDPGPRAIDGWFDAGFQEAVPIILHLRVTAAGEWGGALGFGDVVTPLPTETAGLLASAAIGGVWTSFVGPAYDELEGRTRPKTAPAGLETGRRDIDEVLSDTRLTPRL